jgi:Bacterial sugar transferase
MIPEFVAVLATLIGAIAGAVFIATAQSLVTDEAKARLPHLSRSLIRRAAHGFPAEHVERYGDEWLAEVAAYRDRPLTALVRALGILRGTRALRQELSGADRLRPSIVERLAAGVALIFLAPLLAAIRIESTGPILFYETRRDAEGRPVKILQFRTIHVDPDHPTWYCPEALPERLTRVGAGLLSTGMHDLPFANVVAGDLRMRDRPPVRF